MALFPKIERPCPYRDDLSAIMDGDSCTMCKREVFELSEMSDKERALFLSKCSGEVCVSYKIPVARTLAAAALTSSAILASATSAAQSADSLYCYNDEEMVIIVGGLRKGSAAEIVDTDSELTELPVIYEDSKSIEAALDEFFGMKEPVNEEPTKPADKLYKSQHVEVIESASDT